MKELFSYNIIFEKTVLNFMFIDNYILRYTSTFGYFRHYQMSKQQSS